jgi:hypothetical protein
MHIKIKVDCVGQEYDSRPNPPMLKQGVTRPSYPLGTNPVAKKLGAPGQSDFRDEGRPRMASIAPFVLDIARLVSPLT